MVSLVADNSDMLKVLRDTFGTPESRQAKRDLATKQEQLDSDISVISSTDATITDEDKEAAMLRIAAINPQMANSMRETLARGDKLELEATQRETRKGVEQALLIKNQPDFKSKRTALTQLAQQAQANGEDISRFVDLANASEAELDLELDKMLLQGADIDKLIDSSFASETAEDFTLSPGQVRFDAQGNEVAKVAPKKEQETSLIRNLRAIGIDPNSSEGRRMITESITKPGVKIDLKEGLNFKVPEGFMLLDENDPSKGVTPIPGGPKDSVAGDTAAKAQMLRTAQEAFPGTKELVFDKDGSVNRKNVFNAGINTPFSDGRKLRQQMEFGIQAITRLETGAAMPPQEVENTRERFMPKIGDTTEMADLKLRMYEEFIGGSLKLLDPSGRFDAERFDVEFSNRMQQNTDNAVLEQIGEVEATQTGETTSEGFIIYQRPDGSTFAIKP